MAQIPRYGFIKILTQRTKSTNFQWKTLLQVEGFVWDPLDWIELFVFWRSIEMQLRRKSILIALSGNPWMWESQDYMLQQKNIEIVL